MTKLLGRVAFTNNVGDTLFYSADVHTRRAREALSYRYPHMQRDTIRVGEYSVTLIAGTVVDSDVVAAAAWYEQPDEDISSMPQPMRTTRESLFVRVLAVLKPSHPFYPALTAAITRERQLHDTRLTADTILARSVHGNHFSDGSLLDAMSAFAMDARESIADRARIVRHFDVVMGLTPEALDDEALVTKHEQDTAAMFDNVYTIYPHARAGLIK